MKAQFKPRILASPLSREARPQATTTVEHDEVSTGSSLQSLAAELQQAALQGLFEYPRALVTTTRVAVALLVALAAMHMAVVTIASVGSANTFVEGLLSWRVLGAALGAGAALLLAAFLANLFPQLQITPQGLGVRELFGWRRIPWNQLGVLRVMELPSAGRYAVMIPFKGATKPRTPAPMLKLIPRLAGASQGGDGGVLVTSHMKNFERLLQLLVAYMGHAAGQSVPAIEAFVDETAVMPLAQLALAPEAALSRMSRQGEERVDAYGVSQGDTGPQIVWRKALLGQGLIAAAPVALLLTDLFMRAGANTLSWAHLLWVATVLAFGVLELPFIAKLVQGVGDLMVGSGDFKRSVLAYLELQTPRALLIFVGAALMGLGVPVWVAQIGWLIGIGFTLVLATRFVQRLYYLPAANTLIAAIGILIYQASLFVLYFGFR